MFCNLLPFLMNDLHDGHGAWCMFGLKIED